jgi:glycerol-3-phosphate acyltransferase PlsY
MNIVIYEDMPRYDAGMKILLAVPIAILIFTAIQVYITDGLKSALCMVVPLTVICLIFLLVMPRHYQVLDDGIRVVLGGPFSISYSFSGVKEVVQRRGLWLSVNFVTALASKRVVYVIRSRGMPVAITPTDPQAFISAAGRAMASWKRTGGEG